MRARTPLIVALLLGGVVPAWAASPTALVLRTTSPTSVDILLSRETNLARDAWSFTGKGNVRALVMTPLVNGRSTGQLAAAALEVSAWKGAHQGVTPGPYHLKAGRYRLFVVSDGPIELRLSLPVTVLTKPRGISGARISQAAEKFPRNHPDLPYYRATGHVPVTVGARTVVIQATRWTFATLPPPLTNRSYSSYVAPGAGDCQRQTASADGPRPLLEETEREVVMNVATPMDLDFMGAGCAVSPYSGSDYASAADNVAITVALFP